MCVCLQYGALNGHRAWKWSRLLLVLDILGHEETRKLDYTFHNFNSPCTQNHLSGRLRTSGILVLYGINTYLKVTDVYANKIITRKLWTFFSFSLLILFQPCFNVLFAISSQRLTLLQGGFFGYYFQYFYSHWYILWSPYHI